MNPLDVVVRGDLDHYLCASALSDNILLFYGTERNSETLIDNLILWQASVVMLIDRSYRSQCRTDALMYSSQRIVMCIYLLRTCSSYCDYSIVD